MLPPRPPSSASADHQCPHRRLLQLCGECILLLQRRVLLQTLCVCGPALPRSRRSSEYSSAPPATIILALKTLYTFDFSYTDLSRLIRLSVLPYLNNDDSQLRGQAAITFCKVRRLVLFDPVVVVPEGSGHQVHQ